MIKRIFTFRTSWLFNAKKISTYQFNDSTCTRYINLAWEKLVESNDCAWIDKNVDMQVKLKPLKAGLRMKI